jgi:hypothetical protein
MAKWLEQLTTEWAISDRFPALVKFFLGNQEGLG